MADDYSKDEYEADLLAAVGLAGVRQYRLVRITDLSLTLLAIPVGALLALGIISSRVWLWTLATTIFGVALAAMVVSYGLLARTLAPLFGRSVWWCGNHISAQPVRFVTWVDSQIAAKTGSHVLDDSPGRTAAVDAEERSNRRSRRLLRTSAMLRLSALLLTAVSLLSSHLRGNGSPSSVPVPTTLEQLGVPTDSLPTIKPPPPPSPATPSTRLTSCERVVRLPTVQASFGYIPGSKATTREISGIVLPRGTPLSRCALDESADPAVGATTTIAYLYPADSLQGYVQRLRSSGWQDGGEGTYSYYPAGRSLQVDILPVGKDVVLLAEDVK